jgi:hypothetical protein
MNDSSDDWKWIKPHTTGVAVMTEEGEGETNWGSQYPGHWEFRPTSNTMSRLFDQLVSDIGSSRTLTVTPRLSNRPSNSNGFISRTWASVKENVCTPTGRGTIKGAVSGGVYGGIAGRNGWAALGGALVGGGIGYLSNGKIASSEEQTALVVFAVSALAAKLTNSNDVSAIGGGATEAGLSGTTQIPAPVQFVFAVTTGGALEYFGGGTWSRGGIAGAASWGAGVATDFSLDLLCGD